MRLFDSQTRRLLTERFASLCLCHSLVCSLLSHVVAADGAHSSCYSLPRLLASNLFSPCSGSSLQKTGLSELLVCTAYLLTLVTPALQKLHVATLRLFFSLSRCCTRCFLCSLIEYCWGNASTRWGALRIADGHPQPYRLRITELGNEEWNPPFVEQVLAMEQRARDIGAPVAGAFIKYRPRHVGPDRRAMRHVQQSPPISAIAALHVVSRFIYSFACSSLSFISAAASAGQWQYMYPVSWNVPPSNLSAFAAADPTGNLVSRILSDVHMGSGGGVEQSELNFLDSLPFSPGSINCETNAGANHLFRALQEAADLNDFFNAPPDVASRIAARTASFCTSRSGHL